MSSIISLLQLVFLHRWCLLICFYHLLVLIGLNHLLNCLFFLVLFYLYILTLIWIEWYFSPFPFVPYIFLVESPETLICMLNNCTVNQQLYLPPKLFKDLGILYFQLPYPNLYTIFSRTYHFAEFYFYFLLHKVDTIIVVL